MVKQLPPTYFALVMATGIISITAWEFQLAALVDGFICNLVAYTVLGALTTLRTLRYPRLFFADMTDHQLGPGFFTAVAASCILGTQFQQIAHSLTVAIFLLSLGVVRGLALPTRSSVFTAFAVKRIKPSL